MTWKLTDRAKNIEPIPGVRWRDMDDEEFEAEADKYATIGNFPPRSLHESGFWVHEVGPEPQED